jgi:hypothetical protein
MEKLISFHAPVCGQTIHLLQIIVLKTRCADTGSRPPRERPQWREPWRVIPLVLFSTPISTWPATNVHTTIRHTFVPHTKTVVEPYLYLCKHSRKRNARQASVSSEGTDQPTLLAWLLQALRAISSLSWLAACKGRDDHELARSRSSDISTSHIKTQSAPKQKPTKKPLLLSAPLSLIKPQNCTKSCPSSPNT